MDTKLELKPMGDHLNELIQERYGTRKGFAKVCWERAKRQESVDATSTWLYKIIKGIQRMKGEDLQLFSELLDVSCDELLMGKEIEEDSFLMDNYTVALSNDEKVWETYLQMPERPAIYKDSYGRSLLDYAVEVKNLKLFHYMMDNGYLHLTMDYECDKEIGGQTGMITLDVAGARGARYDFWRYRWEALPLLRKDIICLAIEYGYMDVLDKLHARETPELYSTCECSRRPPTGEECCDPEIMDALVSAKEDVLKYFAEEFEIKDQQGMKFRFEFPFLGELIDKLIEKRSDTAVSLLRKVESHNQAVYRNLCSLKKHAEQVIREVPGNLDSQVQRRAQEKMQDVQFDGWGRTLNYMSLLLGTNPIADKYAGNITRVNAVSKDPRVTSLSDNINSYWDKIHTMTGE